MRLVEEWNCFLFLFVAWILGDLTCFRLCFCIQLRNAHGSWKRPGRCFLSGSVPVLSKEQNKICQLSSFYYLHWWEILLPDLSSLSNNIFRQFWQQLQKKMFAFLSPCHYLADLCGADVAFLPVSVLDIFCGERYNHCHFLLIYKHRNQQ